MEEPRLCHESAQPGGFYHALRKRDEFGSENYTCKENPGAVKEAKLAKLHRHRWRADFFEARIEAVQLFRRSVCPGIAR